MAFDVFIKIGDVKGESKDAAHKEEIDVLAWSWGMTQAGYSHVGGGGGTGKVSVQDLSFTKYVDKATPPLIQFCCSGKHFPEAKLTVRKAGDQPVEYLKLTMADLIVSSVSEGGTGGEERLTENVTLNFAKFKLEYTMQEASGAAGATIPVGWNIEENVPWA